MNKIILILGAVFSTLMITSCVKDLDVTPKDPSIILSGNLNDDPIYMKEVLGKIYASFLLPGQGGSESYNKEDIAASDPNFTTTMRALWNCQELTTDEAICAWGDPGIADFNTQAWSATNPFLTALYSRLVLSVTYANDFIKNTDGSSNADVIKYNAEARFLRALAYYYAMDLFANPPFTTEADGVGKFYPKQLDPDSKTGRTKLFYYITSQLRSIENKLGAPKFSYPRADQAACWMLLARAYLNAQVFTGTAKWDSCKMYCDKVISSGKYSLATNYRQNFSADNDATKNPEMIFSWATDGVYTQGYVGTTFIIESCSDGTHIDAHNLGLTSNTNWGGNRTKKQFLNVLVDTLATYGNVPVPWATDTIFAQCKDKRVFCKRLDHWDIPSPSSSFSFGIGVYKFTANNADGSKAADYNPAYASTDYPIFRYADALLMRAEAVLRSGGDVSIAVADVKTIRDRAFGTAPHANITAAQLQANNYQFILDERGREFYFEGQRRTDLVRFGQFSDGTYKWAWKGGVIGGAATDKHLNIFPIPGDEVSANPNIKQNPGY
ncbi:MAG: RagB/SusD family nutrient uptake outer membrane protein [Bacteroidota bacterium]|nr:RagB/SusD family nutrient uptake outer membrane protein [Bacteroidota bacterium]